MSLLRRAIRIRGSAASSSTNISGVGAGAIPGMASNYGRYAVTQRRVLEYLTQHYIRPAVYDRARATGRGSLD